MVNYDEIKSIIEDMNKKMEEADLEELPFKNLCGTVSEMIMLDQGQRGLRLVEKMIKENKVDSSEHIIRIFDSIRIREAPMPYDGFLNRTQGFIN